MKKIASILAVGLIAGSLSINASAAELTKSAPSKQHATEKVAAKKESGIKATVEKLFHRTSNKKAK